MKPEVLLVCLLIGTSLSIPTETTSKSINEAQKSTETSPIHNDAKEKRQLGDRETRLYPNAPSEDPEQPQETIYGPQPNHFLIRPGAEHPQHIQHLQQPQAQPRFLPGRPHPSQLAQQQEAQGQELQQLQYYQYLQDVARHSPIKPQQQLRKHPAQYVQEVNHFPIQQQQQQQPQPHSPQLQPIAFPLNARQPQQFPQQPYQLIPEEELLKLIEQELISRGYPPIPKQFGQHQTQPQPQQHLPSPSNPKPKQGLGGYRQLRPEENPEPITYIPQQPRPQPQQQHQPQQYIPEQRPSPEEQQQIYQHPTALDYHRAIPNHPLAASTLEKEIEKLFASNTPAGSHHQPTHPPHPQQQPHQRFQSKAFVTTPAPPPNVQNIDFAFAQNFAQLSGFKPSMGIPTATAASATESPKQYSASPQYSATTSAQYDASPSPTAKPTVASLPQYPARQHINTKAHLKRQKPIFHYQKLENPAPVVYYQNQNSDQSDLLSSPPQQQHSQQQYQLPAPSQSTIFVAQGTGIHRGPNPSTASAPKASQSAKSYGEDQSLQLPPPNGKPITEKEFQALLDAGYPVTAVPVPVPVPYDQYIKEHPEYKGEPIEVPLRRPITYLRPIQHQHQEEADKKSS